jgi:hypothetical protein
MKPLAISPTPAWARDLPAKRTRLRVHGECNLFRRRA